MTFGLEVINDNGNKVIGSGIVPYQYTVMGVEATQYYWRFSNVWGFQNIRLTSTSLIALDTVGATFIRGRGSKILPYTYLYQIRQVSEGYFNIDLILEDLVIDTRYENIVTSPKLYVIDRLPPTKSSSGFGLEVYGETGAVELNSSSPIPKVIDHATLTTPFTLGNPATQLLFLHVVPTSSSSSYYKYPGGGSVVISIGQYMEQKVSNGTYDISAWEVEGESGEGNIYRPRRLPIQFTLVERP